MNIISYKSGLSRYRWMIIHVVLLCSIVVTGWIMTNYLGERARQEIIKENETASLLLTTHLTAELKKFEGVVKALAGSPWIAPALNFRSDLEIAKANITLDRYNEAIDASVSYLMDVHGTTIASSNRSAPDSFVGRSYQFRSYYTQAISGQPGRYFGLGITSLKKGFYTSYPVKGQDGEIIGVVAIKKSLDNIERQLRHYPLCFFVDKNGVIFLSSNEEMSMKSLWLVDPAIERELLLSKQFGEKPFDSVMKKEIEDGAEVIFQGNTFLASRRVINPEGWSIVLMTPTDRINIYKLIGVILTLVACLLIIIPLAITFQAVRSAEAIHKSEERFQQVAQSSQDWIWETDREGRYTYSSQAVKHILDYEPEEIIGKYYFDLFVPEERGELTQTFKGFFDRQKSFFRIVNRRVHRSGHNVFVESTGVPLLDAEGTIAGYRGTNRDITDRKQAEEVLRFTQFSVDHISDSIFWTTQDAHFFNVNEASCRKLGYSRDELLSLTVCDIDPNFTKVIWENHWRELKKFGSITYESALQRKNGTIFPVDINANFLEMKGEEYNFAFIRDISERRKAEEEKEKLEKELIQSQKMEAIGTLAGGIAHDFNNLLMGIQGYASLMLFATDKTHPNYHKLKSIVDQVKSGADLTAQLLGFARGGRYEIKAIDLNEAVKNTSAMFGRTKKEVLIHQKYQDNLWPVDVDRGQIEQVLLNLYVNAWQAMPAGGDLYLETENTILDETYIKHFSVTPGKYVKISVTDTGSGMDEKTKERIFEPFFTTKEMGRGTGLGLATVYGIIKGHKGIINVYSEKGQGTTFTIYLPASEKDVIQERVSPEVLVKGHEKLLIIDDEDIIIAVTRDILESLGYIIISAQSGREAIEIYRAHKDEIALVILDMIMPDMGGGDTFDHLKGINPDIKVILSSGYSLNGQAIRIMEKGCYAFIQKPFSVMSLSQKVRDVLEGKM